MKVLTLSSDHADDARFVTEITELVNGVYRLAEDGIWVDGAARTTLDEVATLIRTGQIAVAQRKNRIVGCIRIQQLDADTSEFGMLAVATDQRGIGLGRTLVQFAERESVRSQRGTMQLELLVPRSWVHPSKQFLAAWYTRIGYTVTRKGTIDEAYPHLAPLLATACDFVIYQKHLKDSPKPASGLLPPGPPPCTDGCGTRNRRPSPTAPPRPCSLSAGCAPQPTCRACGRSPV
jgi:predicted GNAT family N-acyltransferase